MPVTTSSPESPNSGRPSKLPNFTQTAEPSTNSLYFKMLAACAGGLAGSGRSPYTAAPKIRGCYVWRLRGSWHREKNRSNEPQPPRLPDQEQQPNRKQNCGRRHAPKYGPRSRWSPRRQSGQPERRRRGRRAPWRNARPRQKRAAKPPPRRQNVQGQPPRRQNVQGQPSPRRNVQGQPSPRRNVQRQPPRRQSVQGQPSPRRNVKRLPPKRKLHSQRIRSERRRTRPRERTPGPRAPTIARRTTSRS